MIKRETQVLPFVLDCVYNCKSSWHIRATFNARPNHSIQCCNSSLPKAVLHFLQDVECLLQVVARHCGYVVIVGLNCWGAPCIVLLCSDVLALRSVARRSKVYCGVPE